MADNIVPEDDDLATRLQKAASDHCRGLDIPHDLGLHLLSVIFASDGNEEERWIYDMENACPYCLGSGHKDDVPHVPLLALDEGN